MVRRTEEKTKVRDPGLRSAVQVTRELSIPASEFRFRFSRSGGAGGQHVNKVSTRVELLFDLAGSPSMTEGQKRMAAAALATRMDATGVLSLVVDTSRSQWKNRELAVERLQALLQHALRPRVKRVPTRAHRGAHERRLQTKKLRSRQKADRRAGGGE